MSNYKNVNDRIAYFNTSLFKPFDQLLQYAAWHFSRRNESNSSSKLGFEDECTKAGVALVTHLSGDGVLFVKRFKQESDKSIIHDETICDCGGVALLNENCPFIASTSCDKFGQNSFGTTLAYIDLPMLVCKICRTSYISAKVLLRVNAEMEKAAQRRVEYSIRKWVFPEK